MKSALPGDTGFQPVLSASLCKDSRYREIPLGRTSSARVEIPCHGEAFFFGSWIVVLCLALGGCSNANVALNNSHVPLEDRQSNHTRAATFTGFGGGDTAPIPTTNPDSRSLPTPGGTFPPPDRDGYFVGLAISGGGSRSANFGAACMFQLERLGLLQKVDYLSSVSGGSLTGAYYCVSGKEDWNPGTVQKKLTHAFANDLLIQTLLPWNTFATAFTDYDRSDMLAAIFTNTLYSRDGRALTYADLRRDRPRLLINSTDLQSGRRFVFCNESFDSLNSDLCKYPIAYAVTASSAVPVLLHPVTLRDFSTSFPQYRHLIDGGVTDNLGIEALLDTYNGQVDAAARDHRANPYPNGAVFIVLDAQTSFNAEISSESDVGLMESLKTALGLTSTSLLQRVSVANMSDIVLRNSPADVTAGQLRKQIQQLIDTGYLELHDRPNHSIRVLYLSLAELNGLKNLPFGNFTESLNGIATYFNITDKEAYNLYQAAEILVRDRFEQRMREIVADLDRAAATRPTSAETSSITPCQSVSQEAPHSR